MQKVLTDLTGLQAVRRAAVESAKARFAQAAGAAGYLDLLGVPWHQDGTVKLINEASVERR